MSVLGNFDLAHVVVAFAAAHDARARAALAAVSPAFRDAASRLTGLDLEFGGNSDAGLARLARDPRACSTAMQGVIAVRVAPGAGLRSHALLVRVLRRAGAGGGRGAWTGGQRAGPRPHHPPPPRALVMPYTVAGRVTSSSPAPSRGAPLP